MEICAKDIENVIVTDDSVVVEMKPDVANMIQEGLVFERKSMETVNPSFFISGGKTWTVCEKCGKVVRVDKPIFGSLHLCV